MEENKNYNEPDCHEAVSILADESDVEFDTLSMEEKEDPFDPEDISITTKSFPMDALLRRMLQGSIILNPDFQRREVWSIEKKSQLIESLMLNIPLPMFYMSSDEDAIYTVVDGLQRLSTIRDFVLGKEYLETKREDGSRNESLRGFGMRLRHLEFWSAYEDKQFNDLPPKLQNRILETNFQVTIINPSTPEVVKRNIFKRINTGGLQLNSQEIRNAIYAGAATDLLNEMSEMPIFKEATGGSVRCLRMEDRELILRFVSFMMRSYTDYNKTVTADTWLSDTMIIVNAIMGGAFDDMRRLSMFRTDESLKVSSLPMEDLLKYFESAMKRCLTLFEQHAFRRSYGDNYRRPINRCLFEMWSFIMGRYTDDEFQRLLTHRREFMSEYIGLLENPDFQLAISTDAMKHTSLKYRFNTLIELTDKYAKN